MCHRDRSGDQLVVGQDSGGRHLIAKLDHSPASNGPLGQRCIMVSMVAV